MMSSSRYRVCTAFAAALLTSFVSAVSAPTWAQNAQYPVEQGYLTAADNVRLFYRKLGNAQDFVVFLHGGPGLSINDGGYIVEPLARRHTLLMYDQRGGGRSDLIKDPKLLTATADVHDLEAVRRNFRINKMSLVGLSWGSGLAALYAQAHPDRVSRIVFLDPMPVANKPFVEERNAKMRALMSPEDITTIKQLEKESHDATDEQLPAICRKEMRISSKAYLFYPARFDGSKWDLCNVPAAATRNVPVVFKAVVGSMGNFDLRPTLERLRMPALVIEGAKTNVPLDSTREWARNPPDARLLLISDAGHATFVDQPQSVLSAIELFLEGRWPEGAKQIGR